MSVHDASLKFSYAVTVYVTADVYGYGKSRNVCGIRQDVDCKGGHSSAEASGPDSRFIDTVQKLDFKILYIRNVGV